MQLSAAELETLSAVFLRLGQAAFMDLPHDEGVSESQRRRSKALWRTLSEYGDAFRVISVWLLALTDDTEVPRCELCYRHLGRGQKHFCEPHRRTSHARQSARDAHIGRAYRFAVNEGLRSQSMVEAMKSFAQNAGRVLPLHVQISRKMLCSTPDSPAKMLVGPVATLASFLHRLHPFLSPSIDELVQSHFVKMLATARAPFLTSPTTQESALKVHALRARAPAWLTWRNFVLTLFASERPKGDESAFVGEKFLGLDADHPIARGMSVSPRSVGLDLWHLRTWKLTERGFDQSAYVHPDVIRKLRRSGPNGKPLSLRAIGKLLGISHEAVRKHLASKESNLKRPSRKRVLPMAQSKQVTR